MNCAKCGSPNTQVQAVTEGRPAGCLTMILYLFLALSLLGLFILIPILLRKKTQTVSYRVCQSCGFRQKLRS